MLISTYYSYKGKYKQNRLDKKCVLKRTGVGPRVVCLEDTFVYLTCLFNTSLLQNTVYVTNFDIFEHFQAQKSKALRAVTKRGQPVMAGRMELLLAKIQEQCSQ